METLEAIKKRMSVHKFKSKAVNRDTLLTILEAGTKAPSAGNSQNWYFVVIDDKDKINRIARATLQPETFYNVPYVVVVCSDATKIRSEYKQRGELYAIQNVAAAIENILLVATDQGVDSVWIGAFADETVKAVLKIPQEVDVHAILPFGYRDEVPFRTRRRSLSHVTWFNTWANRVSHKTFFPLSQHVDKLKAKLKHRKISKQRKASAKKKASKK